MPYYESVYIARPDFSAAQVEALTESLTGIVTENGGQVTKNEYWGLKNLAYRIKKNRKGHYSLLNIDAPSEAISELERNMRISEDVLRYLTVRVDELEEGPSMMLQSRGSRDRDARGRRDRGGRDDRGGRRGGPQRKTPVARMPRPRLKPRRPTPKPPRETPNEPQAFLPASKILSFFRTRRAQDRLQGREASATLYLGTRKDRAEPHHRRIREEAA